MDLEEGGFSRSILAYTSRFSWYLIKSGVRIPNSDASLRACVIELLGRFRMFTVSKDPKTSHCIAMPNSRNLTAEIQDYSCRQPPLETVHNDGL